MLTLANEGDNSNGCEFLITLGESANVLDGYNVVLGELVQGEDVLSKVEESVSRLGSLKQEIKIEDCGTR